MASLQQLIPGGFNSATVEPQVARSFEPLPNGPYEVEITDADVIELKSGNGTGLKIEYTVVTPEHFSNRKIWQNLNIKHTNEQTEQIAQSQLSALCRAVGIGVLNDTDDLFGKMLRVGVKIRPAKGEYPASNDITGYEALGTAMPAAASRPAAAPTRAAAPATAAKTPAWKK
jgi:hypothetical protein